jgi:hypothetical protein
VVPTPRQISQWQWIRLHQCTAKCHANATFLRCCWPTWSTLWCICTGICTQSPSNPSKGTGEAAIIGLYELYQRGQPHEDYTTKYRKLTRASGVLEGIDASPYQWIVSLHLHTIEQPHSLCISMYSTWLTFHRPRHLERSWGHCRNPWDYQPWSTSVRQGWDQSIHNMWENITNAQYHLTYLHF